MDPYLGEIRIFAGNFAPQDWLICDGSLLSINSYTPLFSLLGTLYGGDGVNNFGIPDLRGRMPIGRGQGTELTNWVLGAHGGTEIENINVAQTPLHTHSVKASTSKTQSIKNPTSNSILGPLVVSNQVGYAYVNTAGTIKTLDDSVIHPFPGGGQPHNNMMQSFAFTFIICTSGIYPTSN